MKKHRLIFFLAESESITMEFFTSFEDFHPCYEIIVKFMAGVEEYTLGIGCIENEIESLYYAISYALKNQLILHESITQDIGYLANESLQRNPNLVYVKHENVSSWVGLENLLWSTPSKIKPVLSTWLFNNPDSSIVLEVTPHYPWRQKTAEDSIKNYVPYGDWIKNYEPLFIRTIPREQALMWQQQAKTILDILENNSIRIEHKVRRKSKL